MPPFPSNGRPASSTIGSGLAGAALPQPPVPARAMTYSSVVRGQAPEEPTAAPEIVSQQVHNNPPDPVEPSIPTRQSMGQQARPHVSSFLQAQVGTLQYGDVLSQLQRVRSQMQQRVPEHARSQLQHHEAALQSRRSQLEQQMRDDRQARQVDRQRDDDEESRQRHRQMHIQQAEMERQLAQNEARRIHIQQAEVERQRAARRIHMQQMEREMQRHRQIQREADAHQLGMHQHASQMGYGHPFRPHRHHHHGLAGSDDDMPHGPAYHHHMRRHRHPMMHPFGMHHHDGMSDSDDGSPRPELPMGYPEEWVVDRAQVTDDMSCVICTEIMRNPSTMGPCGHTFCRDCISHVREPHCPLCRGRRHQLRPVTALADAIGALVGKCPKCSFSGSLSDVRAHEGECDTQRALAWLRNVLPAGPAATPVTPELRADAVRALASPKLIDLFAGLLGHIGDVPAPATPE